jgi:hypothetical protein
LGAAVTAVVVTKAPNLLKGLVASVKKMADKGLAPEWPEDPRFDEAAMVKEDNLAELLARLAILKPQLSDEQWGAIVRGEDIGLWTNVEGDDYDASITFTAKEEEPDEAEPELEEVPEVEQEQQDSSS